VAGNVVVHFSHAAIAKVYEQKPTVLNFWNNCKLRLCRANCSVSFALTGKKPFTFTDSDGTESHCEDLIADFLS
jgi:hypothetical protein